MIDEATAAFLQFVVGDPIRSGLFLLLVVVARMYQSERAEVKRLQGMLEERIMVALETIKDHIRDSHG